jgi:alpha-amylase
MTEASGNADKMKSAATLLLTIPGTPFIYYGEEIGMTGEKPDPNLRTPMQWTAEENGGFTTGTPWEPLQDDYPLINVDSQLEDESSLLSHYRTLIRLRLAHSALRTGEYLSIETGNNRVYAALRTNAEESILILINLGNEAITDLALSLSEGPFQGSYALISLFGDVALENLTANEAGGFSAYSPSLNIPANMNGVYLLEPIE